MMRRHGGFTLIELMVTLAMAAIVLTVGVPSFRDMVKKNEMAGATNRFVGALKLARSEAIKRGVPVSICKSNDGATCTGAGTNWEDGWIVFVNADNDSPAAVDAGETILRVMPALKNVYTLRGTNSNNFASSLTYLPSGRGNNMGRFVLCENNQLADSRVVFINITGRVYLGQDVDGNKIPEDTSGNDITTCTP